MQVRKSAVRIVFIKVEKYTFCYNYVYFISCPQSASLQCVYHCGKKKRFDIIILCMQVRSPKVRSLQVRIVFIKVEKTTFWYDYTFMQVRMSAIRIQVYIYLLHIYATLSNIMYNFTPYD